MEALNLALLDQPSPCDLYPGVWQANLDALRVDQPDFAERLMELSIPAHWHPVLGMDDFPTWRLEHEHEAPVWLGGTAAPRTRSLGILRFDLIQDKNTVLPSIAAGGELVLLLERLSHQQCVYVFEDNATALAAVLRQLDLAAEIRSGRCIFIPSENEEAALASVLDRHPGLLPPGSFISLPNVPDERFTELRGICERVTRRVHELRNRKLRELKVRDVAPLSRGDNPPKLAVLAFGTLKSTYRLATDLEEASLKLGWSTCRRAASGPREMHSLPHHEALTESAPQIAITIDHAPGTLPLPKSCLKFQWHLHAWNVQDVDTSDNLRHLAASPTVTEALRRAGVPTMRIHPFYWALSETLGKRVLPSVTPTELSGSKSVILIGDCLNSSPEACGIEHPTHKQLWAQLHKTASERCFSSDIRQANQLMRQAEAACGIKISETTLRERFLRIVERTLIPAIVLQTISQRLVSEDFQVLTIGKGWQRCSNQRIRHLADDVERLCTPSDAGSGSLELPAMAIFTDPLDPLNPALFHTIASRWALLIFNPDAKPLTQRIDGILRPNEHYQPFSQPSELLAAIDGLRTNLERTRRLTERTFEHVATNHTYQQRLTALLDEIL